MNKSPSMLLSLSALALVTALGVLVWRSDAGIPPQQAAPAAQASVAERPHRDPSDLNASQAAVERTSPLAPAPSTAQEAAWRARGVTAMAMDPAQQAGLAARGLAPPQAEPAAKPESRQYVSPFSK